MCRPAGGAISARNLIDLPYDTGVMTALNSMQDKDGTVRFNAHWTIFLPALTVAFIYGGLWVFLLIAGKGDTALARILLLVLLLVAPVLLVRAYLRQASFSLHVGRHVLRYRRGWLRPRWRQLQMNSLTSVRASANPLGRILGGGALIITRLDGSDIALYDVASPEQAARQISRRLRSSQARHKSV